MKKLIELNIAYTFAKSQYETNLENYNHDILVEYLSESEYEMEMKYWLQVCKEIEYEILSIIRTNYPTQL